jgi:hypothetical protein
VQTHPIPVADLLGGDFSLAEIRRLYRCHDKLAALFDHLTARWRDLFDAKYEVLLFDLTSTYLKAPRPPIPPTGGASATAATSAPSTINSNAESRPTSSSPAACK